MQRNAAAVAAPSIAGETPLSSLDATALKGHEELRAGAQRKWAAPFVGYGVNRLCDALGISRALLYDLWARNEGPRYVMIGRRRIVTSEALQEWLRSLEGAA